VLRHRRGVVVCTNHGVTLLPLTTKLIFAYSCCYCWRWRRWRCQSSHNHIYYYTSTTLISSALSIYADRKHPFNCSGIDLQVRTSKHAAPASDRVSPSCHLPDAPIFGIDSTQLFDHRSSKPSFRQTLLRRLPAAMVSAPSLWKSFSRRRSECDEILPSEMTSADGPQSLPWMSTSGIWRQWHMTATSEMASRVRLKLMTPEIADMMRKARLAC